MVSIRLSGVYFFIDIILLLAYYMRDLKLNTPFIDKRYYSFNYV